MTTEPEIPMWETRAKNICVGLFVIGWILWIQSWLFNWDISRSTSPGWLYYGVATLGAVMIGSGVVWLVAAMRRQYAARE